ncbi:MAG: DUF4097 family beta strand repeat-containing protein [Planctomycetota bacterium]|jgi:DUF4097 and DUF4098 domain-containing protein YvlB
MNRTLSRVVAAALLVLAGCGPSFRAQRSMSTSAEHLAGTGIVVDSRNGSVRVIGDSASSGVTIDARLACGGATQAEADERVAAASIGVERTSDRTLRIEPVFPGGPRQNDGASITVTIPDAAGVRIHTSNGRVEVERLAGRLDVDTSNGRVTVDAQGGAVDVRTSNGPVEIRGGRGPVRVDTSNGSVDVRLVGDGRGPVQVNTSNGSIALAVGEAFAGRVRMSTSNGTVRVSDDAGRVRSTDLGRTRGAVVVGDGGEPSALYTSNGSVRLIIE